LSDNHKISLMFKHHKLINIWAWIKWPYFIRCSVYFFLENTIPNIECALFTEWWSRRIQW